MEARLGAKLDTVEVQTEYVDEEETAPWSLLLLKIYILIGSTICFSIIQTIFFLGLYVLAGVQFI